MCKHAAARGSILAVLDKFPTPLNLACNWVNLERVFCVATLIAYHSSFSRQLSISIGFSWRHNCTPDCIVARWEALRAPNCLFIVLQGKLACENSPTYQLYITLTLEIVLANWLTNVYKYMIATNSPNVAAVEKQQQQKQLYNSVFSDILQRYQEYHLLHPRNWVVDHYTSQQMLF